MAPGNSRSVSSIIWPIFWKAPSPSTVGRALTTTFLASGAIAWTTSRSIVVSPDGLVSGPPTTVGVNVGSPLILAKASRSDWAKPLNANTTTVVPLPVNPSRTMGVAL
jgi:hypothetical protein